MFWQFICVSRRVLCTIQEADPALLCQLCSPFTPCADFGCIVTVRDVFEFVFFIQVYSYCVLCRKRMPCCVFSFSLCAPACLLSLCHTRAVCFDGTFIARVVYCTAQFSLVPNWADERARLPSRWRHGRLGEHNVGHPK